MRQLFIVWKSKDGEIFQGYWINDGSPSEIIRQVYEKVDIDFLIDDGFLGRSSAWFIVAEKESEVLQ